MKVIITGGHHNSALVIAEALRQKGHDVTWVGHRHSMISDPHESLEYQEVLAANFPFINLMAGKFHSRAHPLYLIRIPLGFIQSLLILRRIKPDLIVSFGGYIAVPVALAGKLMRVPVITCEQTATVGRGNQLISRFSEYNFLSWDSSSSFFPPQKTAVVGLPLHPNIFAPQAKKWFDHNRPIILITGGKQGSHIINQTVFSLLPRLVKDFNVIHQTGASLDAGDFREAEKIGAGLPKELQSAYFYRPHFSSAEMLEAIKAATIVISRSGAHITYELLTLGKPAILIPLPFSYLNEQAVNAQKLVAAGSGVILDQSELSPDTLEQAIISFRKNLSTFDHHAAAAKKLTLTDATEKIVAYICQHFSHASS